MSALHDSERHISTASAPCGLPSKSSTASFWHSEPSNLLKAHRSTRELPGTADVVIVGSGMTGASVAHHLLTDDEVVERSGKKPRVVMLEAREACWGATGRNGGHCQPVLFEHPHDPSIPHFELANYHALADHIKAKFIDCEWVAQPAIRALYERGQMNAIELSLYQIQQTSPDLAERVRLVTTKSELEQLRIPTALGAVVTDIAARMWPYKFVARILEDLIKDPDLHDNFNLQCLTPVKAIAPGEHNGWKIETDRGNIAASKVILATNAYTSHLVPSFADLIVPCRGQMSALLPDSTLAEENRLETSFGFMGEGIDDYLVQRSNDKGGHLMFGGGRQHSLSIGVTDDSVIDKDNAQYLRRELIKKIGRKDGVKKEHTIKCTRCRMSKRTGKRESSVVPCRECIQHERLRGNSKPSSTFDRTKVELRATHEWTGIMGFSRDDLPWVGPVPKHPDLFMAAGFTGHGMPNCWLSGRAVARMAMGVNEVTSEELPKSYLLTEERMRQAREIDTVQARDWAEMERGRRQREGRNRSGYA